MHEVELVVEAPAEVDVETVARLAKHLQDDLRADGRVSVARKPGVVPEGARSGAATQIGALIVTGVFSATTVKAVRDVVLRRMARSSRASATISWRADAEQGRFSVESEGLAPEELTALVAAWSRSGSQAGQAGQTNQTGQINQAEQADQTDHTDQTNHTDQINQTKEVKGVESGSQTRAPDRD
ncbi:hypothetical protein GCM10009839_60710 [Catenulispora yoronensis]|uniref:Uncharacterized protein n=1 Tax=Catenulispora yoronensis TaxID=450799 RepID=A0ABP5GQP1_9ACTN